MIWAYHTTTEQALVSIAASGLRPYEGSIHARQGAPILFFTENAADAYRYFIDREYPILLRFPWPSDAVQYYTEEWMSKSVVPPHVIAVYTGSALDHVADAYYLSDMEDRFDVLDDLPASFSKKIERARTWAPLVEYVDELY